MLSSDPVILEAKRLRLVQCSISQLAKLIEGPEEFTRAFGHRVIDGYRGFPERLEFAMAKLTQPDPDSDWWAPFFFIRQEDRTMIGLGGFKGPPDADGVAEFGYAIAPSCRNQGLATEAVTALVQYLFSISRVTVARACTLPGPSASTRVLEKCGFKHVDDVIDPEDGPVWRWESKTAASQGVF